MAFKIKQNDTSPALQATLKDASLSVINLTGATVRFHMKSVGGTVKIDAPMDIISALGGVVRYDWQAGDTDTVDTYYIEFEVTYVDSSVETFPNDGSDVLNVVRELS